MCPELDPNKILEHEFKHAETTLADSNEDRVKTYLYYLGGAATLVTSIKVLDPTNLLELAVVVVWLGCFSIIGCLLLLKLIRLREMWLDGVRAMAAIKEYYVAHPGRRATGTPPNLDEAFYWYGRRGHGRGNIPAPGSEVNIGLLMGASIALVSACAAGAIPLLIGCAGPTGLCPAVILRSAIVTTFVFVLEIGMWRFLASE